MKIRATLSGFSLSFHEASSKAWTTIWRGVLSRFSSLNTSEPSGAIANKSLIPPKLVLTCRPISIQPEEIISGRAVIMSSRYYSVASFETVSASGVAPTFQMACWMGMDDIW